MQTFEEYWKALNLNDGFPKQNASANYKSLLHPAHFNIGYYLQLSLHELVEFGYFSYAVRSIQEQNRLLSYISINYGFQNTISCCHTDSDYSW